MPEILNDLSLATLVAPIEGGSGEDLSFSALFDQIKEARRADPDYLTQGDWQTDLKTADWEQVINLSAQGLAQQSKDLMLVAWLCEGLAQREHFEGITFGLELTEQLLVAFWETLYPTLEDGLDERAARLSWLKTTLTDIAGGLPIIQGQHFGVLRYDESRHVENLALQNPKAMQTALNEGKINAEIFQRSVALTDTDYLRAKAQQIVALETEIARIQWTKVENRDPVKTYNKVEIAKLAIGVPMRPRSSRIFTATGSACAGSMRLHTAAAPAAKFVVKININL